LANLVRAKGLEPSFPDMTQDFQRVVEEARPAWFLRENVPQAPDIKPAGYDVRSFMLDNSTLDSGDGTGNEQMRKRRFWFGVRDGECPELRAFMDFALYELPNTVQAVAGDTRSVPVAMGGSGKRKVTAVGGHDGHSDQLDAYKKAKSAPVTGRNEGAVGAPGKDYSPPRRTLEEMLRLQGLPEDWLKHQPWTMQAKRKIVGNGVAVPMGRQLARAIQEAMGPDPTP
jgi:site-specific DNA-cytosine methylase